VSTPIAVHRPGGPAPQGAGRSGGLSSLTRNRSAMLAAGGAGLVVLVALLRRGGGGATSTDPAGTSQNPYDSTASDLYNSIQPEIDALASQLSNLQNGLGTPATPPHVTTLPATINHPLPFPRPGRSGKPSGWTGATPPGRGGVHVGVPGL
jgi:hypothetical protein